MSGLSADEMVYFADDVRSDYQTRPVFVWVKAGSNPAVKTTAGRGRESILNIFSRLNAGDFRGSRDCFTFRRCDGRCSHRAIKVLCHRYSPVSKMWAHPSGEMWARRLGAQSKSPRRLYAWRNGMDRV